jgi:serine/threonine-protein kinase
MAELTVESGPLSGQTLTFTQDTSFLVGSGEGCSLRLQDPGIADQHLVIKALKDGGFGIKMLGGPFSLNGKDAEAARLREGDIIELADTRLRFGPKKTSKKSQGLGNLGGYQRIEILGKGGHGTVYRAEQMSLHRNVALKVLPKETTKNPEFVGRFVAEARAAARLSHPNVVQVFDVGHDGDTYFLSMEIMELGSLEDRLKRDGRIDWQECLQLIIDAAHGLAYAESMRIVHRDIKPDNLMVDIHGTVKIADLGLAMSDDEEQGKIVGTPHFMSPEQATGKPLDHRSDLYSLGCTFFRLTTGRPLFQRSTSKDILRAHVKDEPESADEIHSEIPAGVAAVINQLVEKDPDDRYQSSEDLIEDLNQLLNPPAKRGLLILALAALLLGASGVIYHLATRAPTIITTNSGDPAKTAALERQLREQQAENALGKILRNADKLNPLQLAKLLDVFAVKPDFNNTPAAAAAISEANTLRAKEIARVDAAKARSAAVKVVQEKLEFVVAGHLTAAKYSDAITALKLNDTSSTLRNDPTLRAAVATLKKQVSAAADTQLAAMKAAVITSQEKRDPEAMLFAIADLEAILDKTAGWPPEVLSNRPEVVSFIKAQKRAVTTLRSSLASSRESSARANYYRVTSGKSGILAAIRAFDLASATLQASKLHQELEGFKIQPRVAQLLASVQAAESYWNSITAAAAAGQFTITTEIDGKLVEVKVQGFDPKTGLQIDHATTPNISLKSLLSSGLSNVFSDTSAGTDQSRLAFLGLHALADHMSAAKDYMSTLDPEKPDSGDQRYTKSMTDLNYVVHAIRKIDTDWQKFLSREIKASQQLARGLRAFSMTQYTRSHAYLEDLRNTYEETLILQLTR